MPNNAPLEIPAHGVAPSRFSEHIFGALLPAGYLLAMWGLQTIGGLGVRGMLNIMALVLPAFQCVVLWTWILKGDSIGSTRLRLLVRDNLLVGSLCAAGIGVAMLMFVQGAPPQSSVAFEADHRRPVEAFLFLLAICFLPLGTALVFWRRFRESAADGWPHYGWAASAISVGLCLGLWIGLPIGLHYAATNVAVEAVAVLEHGTEQEREAALARLGRWNRLIQLDWMHQEWRTQSSNPNRLQAIELAHMRLTGVSPGFFMD